MNLKQIMEAIGLKQAELKKLIGEAKNAEGTFADATDEEVKAIDGLETELKSLDEQRVDAEAKLKKLEGAEKTSADFEAKNIAFIKSQRPKEETPGKPEAKSLHLISDLMTDELHAKFVENPQARHEFRNLDMKTLFSTTNGGVQRARQEDRIVEIPTRATNLFDYLNAVYLGSDESDSVSYLVETLLTNNADFVAESTQSTPGTLPESAFEFAEVLATAQIIGHTLPVTEKQIKKNAEFMRIINTQMMWGVRDRGQYMALQGNGTVPNIRGFLNFAGIGTQAKGSDTIQDAFVKAHTKVQVDGMAEPDFLIIHPTDAQTVLLTKDGNQRPILSSEYPKFAEMWAGRLETTAIPQGTSLIGDRRHLMLEVIGTIGIETGTVNTQFNELKRTIRAWCEMRTRVFRPGALCKVTGL